MKLVTDGSLHLRQALIPECTKKNIKLPDYYYSYYDVCKELHKCRSLCQKMSCLDDNGNQFNKIRTWGQNSQLEINFSSNDWSE